MNPESETTLATSILSGQASDLVSTAAQDLDTPTSLDQLESYITSSLADLEARMADFITPNSRRGRSRSKDRSST